MMSLCGGTEFAMAQIVQIDLPNNYSDGDSAKWPVAPYESLPNDSSYREEMARRYLLANLTVVNKGTSHDPPQRISNLTWSIRIKLISDTTYMFNNLPVGYAVFHKKRENDLQRHYVS